MNTNLKKGMLIMTAAFIMVFCVTTKAAGSVAVSLPATKKEVQSSWGTFEAGRMYCEVTSASKYPVKFQAYGRNSISGKAYLEKSVVYNVNAKGTQQISSRRNQHKIKLTGWNVGSSKKNCIGWGKIY